MERELLVFLLGLVSKLDGAQARPVRGAYSDLDILAVLLWAAVCDRPISWATQRRHWPLCLHRRPLPTPSTMSRRLRRPEIHALLEALIASMRLHGEGDRTLIVDGRALVIAKHSADPDAGFGRGPGGIAKGYKLHEVIDLLGNCRCFRVEPLNVSEHACIHEMIETMTDGEADELLADAGYDSNRIYEAAGQRGVQLLAERRHKAAKGIGHHRHSEYRLRAIGMMVADPERLAPRRLIESGFGTQGNTIGGLGPLPNSVRTLRRVRLWVAAKLAIDAAHRWKRNREKAA